MRRFFAAAFLTLSVGIALSIASFAADAGADLFKTKCASCHGPDGKGETAVGKSMKVHDLGSKEVQEQPDSGLQNTVTNGKGKMPGYKGKLTDEQIESLVRHIRTLKK